MPAAGISEADSVRPRVQPLDSGIFRDGERSISGVTAQVMQGIRASGRLEQSMAADHSTIRIQLDPPELGAVSVEIQRSEQVTKIHIVADEVVAHSLLERMFHDRWVCGLWLCAGFQCSVELPIS